MPKSKIQMRHFKEFSYIVFTSSTQNIKRIIKADKVQLGSALHLAKNRNKTSIKIPVKTSFRPKLPIELTLKFVRIMNKSYQSPDFWSNVVAVLKIFFVWGSKAVWVVFFRVFSSVEKDILQGKINFYFFKKWPRDGVN